MFLLVILKIKEPALYAEFISGKGRCAVVIDYFINQLPMRSVGPSGSYYSVSTTKEAAQMIEFLNLSFLSPTTATDRMMSGKMSSKGLNA